MGEADNGVSLNCFFQSHATCRAERARRKLLVLNAFSVYVSHETFNDWYLGLYKFACVRPLLYLHDQTVEDALVFFNLHPDLTLQTVTSLQSELSHAIFSLLRPGPSWAREGRISLDKPEDLAEFEGIWHPEYQRYCEHILNHLIQVPLGVIGLLKNKDYKSLTLSKRAEMLRRNGLANLCEGYNSVVRNAIAHGRISFGLSGVVYSDISDEAQLGGYEFAKLFDQITDTCHSLIVAIWLFLCENKSLVERSSLESLPLALRLMFVDAVTSHTSLQLLTASESLVLGGRRQLNIVCRINTRSRWVQLYEGMHLCWAAIRYGGCSYDRYAVSMDCGSAVPVTIFVNGGRLHRAICDDESLDQLMPEILESSLLWYDAPKLSGRLYFWRTHLNAQWPVVKHEIIDKWRANGLKVTSSRYDIRYIENRSAGSLPRVMAHIVTREQGFITEQLLLDIVRDATRRLRRHYVRGRGIDGAVGLPRRPVYIWLRLYRRDRRLRTLMASGWSDEGLLLLAEWFPQKQSTGAIVVKQPDVVVDNIRVQYRPGIFGK
jgi:hypothetical protein